MKKDEHGNDIGVHLPIFDYTANTLVSIKIENTIINTEIQMVIALPYDKRVAQKWCGSLQRTPGSIYKHNNLSMITGIGKKKQQKIEMIYNINSVMELSILTDNEVVELAKTCNLDKHTVYDCCEQCQVALPGKCPFLKKIDYVENQVNPYECRYSADNWQNQIRKVARSGLT
jgi:hypothetical protein